MASSIRIPHHANLHGTVVWLRVFVARTPDLELTIDGTAYLADDSEVHPDVFLNWDPPKTESGRLRDDGYVALQAPCHMGRGITLRRLGAV